MKNIITIIKKELSRFFKDMRLVLTTLILPGAVIFIIYSTMGSVIDNFVTGGDDYIASVNVVNLPESIELLIETFDLSVDLIAIEETEIEQAKEQIVNKKLDLLMVFPINFDQLVDDALNNGGLAPNVSIFYNAIKNESAIINANMVNIISQYEQNLSNVISLNNDPNINYNLASSKDMTGQMLSMILPFLILSLLFSGCLAVTPESIAGEKERGTIATLLVTPIKRKELAIGKILSLSILASLAALSSFTGTILSLPKMLALQMEDGSGGGLLSYFAITDFVAIIVLIVAIVLVIVSFLAVLSASARSVKEATALASPFMIVVILVGMFSMFTTTIATNPLLYIIPVYGPTQALIAVFSFQTNWLHILLSALSSIVYAILFGYGLVKMFESERVMFKK